MLGIGARSTFSASSDLHAAAPAAGEGPRPRHAVRGHRTEHHGDVHLDYLDYSRESRAFQSLGGDDADQPDPRWAAAIRNGCRCRSIPPISTCSWFSRRSARLLEVGERRTCGPDQRPALATPLWRQPRRHRPAAHPGQRHFIHRRDAAAIPVRMERLRLLAASRPNGSERPAPPQSRRLGRLEPGVTWPARSRRSTPSPAGSRRIPGLECHPEVSVRDLLERLERRPPGVDRDPGLRGRVRAADRVLKRRQPPARSRHRPAPPRSLSGSRWARAGGKSCGRCCPGEHCGGAGRRGSSRFGLSFAGAKLLLPSPHAADVPADQTRHSMSGSSSSSLLVALVAALSPGSRRRFRCRASASTKILRGGRGNTGGGGQVEPRSALVVVEVTLALILLLSSGLLIQSFIKMQDIKPGVPHEGLLDGQHLSARYEVSRPPSLRVDFFRAIYRARGDPLPGVRAALATTGLPRCGAADRAARSPGRRPGDPGRRQRVFLGAKPVCDAGLSPDHGHRAPAGPSSSTSRTPRTGCASRSSMSGSRSSSFRKIDPIGKRLKWGRDLQSKAPWADHRRHGRRCEAVELDSPAGPRGLRAVGAGSSAVQLRRAPDRRR